MKLIFRISFLIFFMIILQGSGYVGDLPNIEEYFSAERELQNSGTLLDIYKNPIEKPPSLDAKNLKKQLAPSNYTSEQIKILRPAKKPVYYDDLLVLKSNILKLQDASLKSTNVQAFAACINVQKFYFDNFLEKYKNTPEAKQEIYKSVKDVNSWAQVVANQWRASAENIKFVSYSSFNGAYQPIVIKEKLHLLDKKTENLIKLLESAQ